MSEFNQAKFESKAKKLVAKHLNDEVDEKDVIDEKDVSIVWFSNVGENAKAMLEIDPDHDRRLFTVTYFGEDGEYIVDVYSYVECDKSDEEL